MHVISTSTKIIRLNILSAESYYSVDKEVYVTCVFMEGVVKMSDIIDLCTHAFNMEHTMRQ